MTADVLSVLTLVAALGCGLVAGIFFVFPTFIMKALARIPAAQGIAAMQFINITVINPWFMMAFMGTAVACALLTGYAVLHWSETGAGYLLTWAWIIKKVEEGQSGHVLYSSSEGTSPPELVIDITGGVLDSDGDGVLDTVFWPCGRALIIAL